MAHYHHSEEARDSSKGFYPRFLMEYELSIFDIFEI